MQRYTIHDPRFRRYAMDNATLDVLATGFRWLEGPVWQPAQNTLIFSDIPNDRICRWTQSNGIVDTFREPSGYANGAAIDAEGRLLHCHHGLRAVTRTNHDGSIQTLASHYNGKRLNSPNDLTVKSDGTIWFTDPNYGLLTNYQGNKAPQELPTALYRYAPATNTLTRMSDAFTNPNGICFSPDERTLYVSETGDMFAEKTPHHIAAFRLPETPITLPLPTMFAHIAPGYADGFCCDEDGNLWTSGQDGVHCLDPDGTLLGVIHTESLVSNLCFGGPKQNRLFICASHTLLAIYVNTAAAAGTANA